MGPFEPLSKQNEVNDQYNQNDNKIDEVVENEDNKECEKCGRYFSNLKDINSLANAIKEDINDGRREKQIREKIGQENIPFMINFIDMLYLQHKIEETTEEQIEEDSKQYKEKKSIEEEFGRDYLECYICKKRYKQSQKDEYYDHEDICGKDTTKERKEEREEDEEKDTNIEETTEEQVEEFDDHEAICGEDI